MREERMTYIENYINDLSNQLEKMGIVVPTDQLNRLINRYKYSTSPINEIIEEINQVAEEYVSRIRQIQQAREKLKDSQNRKELSTLPVQYQGITLNQQDIELMKIVDAKSLEQLRQVVKQIPILKGKDIDFSQDLESAIESAFHTYQDSLISIEDTLEDPMLVLRKKLELFLSSEDVSPEIKEKVRPIVDTSESREEVAKKLEQVLTEEEQHEAYGIINNLTVVEKEGIKQTKIEAVRNLLEQVRSRNSITLDEVGKYGNIVLPDGSFNFTKLQECLDFAKQEGKKVRINTLIFYMDCPKELYDLEKTEENKELVKQKLMDYVDATTKFIRDNGYSETVRSIDVMNEVLNRFPMTGNQPYQYRGDITSSSLDDNIMAGWLKHLTIEDLCDVLTVARKNLPSTDFMYNEDNLVDPNKLPLTFEMLNRIQQYEKNHNIRLIDSIGTQMHINSNVKNQDVKNMFHQLQKLRLPIEITEFDLKMVDGKSGDLQTEIARQLKINDLYSIFQEEPNLRGFTIWSKTDSQSFLVALENRERKKHKQPFIKSQNAGYFTEKMTEKSEALGRELTPQKYNYHTHTNRCGHASIATDKEYVALAKESGIQTLGFSDHIPNPSIEFPQDKNRMTPESFGEYLFSIRSLAKENPDMTILCGLEAEYDSRKITYLNELKNKLDYLILGQHFVIENAKKVKKDSPDYPLKYAKSVCEAMDTGLFDIVAHPDIFMETRDLISEQERPLFDKNAQIASKMICEKSKDLGIPLEINLKNLEGNKTSIPYPNPMFWSEAAKVQAPVLYGADAHTPESLLNMTENRNKVSSIIPTSKLNFVKSDYNPVKDRPKELIERRKNVEKESKTYETQLVTYLISSATEENKKESIESQIHSVLQKGAQKTVEDGQKKLAKRKEQIMQIGNNPNLSNREKAFLLTRTKNTIKSIRETMKKRENVLSSAMEDVRTATTLGCTTKKEYIKTVGELTEQRTNKKKGNTEELASMFHQPKQQEAPKAIEKPKTYSKRENKNTTGMITPAGILLLTGFLLLTMAILMNLV